MAKLITIPLFVLFCTLIYFFFEVPILKGMVWATGDGLVNSWAIDRMLLHEENDKVGELTKAVHPKTRFFALIAAHKGGIQSGLNSVPELIKDPDWEVRVQALKVAKARKITAAGPSVVTRLESDDPMDASGARARIEEGLLLETLVATASPLSANGLARMAITTTVSRKIRKRARKALWTLDPVPQAVEAYQEILNNPEVQRPSSADRAACLRAAAAFDLPGTLGHLTLWARKGRKKVQYAAIKGLGDLGGEGAKKYLETLIKPPSWKKRTKHNLKKQELAKRALERIRRKEAGMADIADEPEDVPDEPADGTPGDPTEPSVEDLLAAYGSDAEDPAEVTTGESAP